MLKLISLLRRQEGTSKEAFRSWVLDEHSSTGLEFPMWLYYAALPAGGFLMLLRYLIRLYRYLFAFDPATMTVGAHPHE